MAQKREENLEKEKLLAEIERLKKELKKRKKYGLVWEEKPEEVVEMCKQKLPILKEVKSKEIITDPDKPVNLLIEGDNYHALSVLNYTHEKKIDVIYIDPPYNTGNSKEWKFNDKWIDKNDFFRHSKWLSFIAKRLKLCKDLLRPEGVLMISIDDNEYAHLKILCDEVFGDNQYIGTLVWEKKKKGSHLDNFITNIKEYVLVYCKNTNYFKGLIGEITQERETYPCVNPGNGFSKRIIPKGIKSNYNEKDYVLKKGQTISAGNMKLILHSDLIIKNGCLAENATIEAEWRYGQENINEYANKGELYITRDLYIRRIVVEPRNKKLKDLLPRLEDRHLVDLKDELIEEYSKENPNQEKTNILKEQIQSQNYLSTINDYDNLYKDGWGSNEDSDNEQREFFGEKVFDYPKPNKLIQKLIASTRIKNGIILDFFAGTGTTGEAVLKLNMLGNNNQFILCTNNEDNNEKELKIATDICYPRLTKVINGYQSRSRVNISPLRGNLKYFKTDFVDAESTDKNKKKLTEQATEMLRIREGTFEPILEQKKIKIFKSSNHYTGIIFDQLSIPEFKKAIKGIKGKFSVYVFSLGDDTFDEEFEDIKQKVKLSPIPEAILRVYRRIFK